LLVVGPTIPQAFSNIYRAELACKAQVLAVSSGAELVMPSEAVIAKTNHLYRPEVRRPFGILEWPALLRKLDRIDPSYKN
jgi:ribulose-5-phosphate 4-epimerase/fuculose-1-phosphate aldolase